MVMMPKTTFHRLDTHLAACVASISNAVKLTSSEPSIYSWNNRPLITQRPSTKLRMLCDDDIDCQVALTMIRGLAAQAELAYAAPTAMTMRLASMLADRVAALKASGTPTLELKSQLIKLRETLDTSCCERMTKVMSMDQAQDIVFEHVSNVLSRELVIAATDAAGLKGKIAIRKQDAYSGISIELIEGYVFDLVQACSLNSIEKWTRKSAKCLIIDGIIESVAEIDSIFQHAYAAHEPLLLLCRGYGDDVISTIVANRMRHTLDAMPLRVPYDERSANTLNDLAIVCGCDVISSLKGELISTIDYASLPTVDSVSVLGETLSIDNLTTRDGVTRHTAWLQKMRDDAESSGNEAISGLYASRIKSMSSYTVDVVIGADTLEAHDVAEQADYGFRLMKSCLVGGIIDIDSVLSQLSSDVPLSITNDQRFGTHATLAFIASYRAAIEFVSKFCLASGMIVSD